MGRLKIAWARSADHMQYTCAQNSNVHPNIIGIMSNVITILIKAKWFPKALHVWQDEHGSSWVMSGAKLSPDVVANAINRSFTNLEMYRAASHYNGKGLSEGMHYNATMANLRCLTDKQYDIKCILETIMSAATWPAERINNAFPAYPCCCPRCGGEIEDALHCFWTCPANNNILEDSVQNTQHLIPAAVAKCKDAPCLWLRGLLPSSYISIPPEDEPCVHSSISWINITVNNVCIGSGTYYGDASGGEFTRYPDIRRVGVAFAQVSASGSLIFAAHFPLSGEFQTVARGELTAVVELIRLAQHGTDICFVTGNKTVYNNYVAGRNVAALSSDCDLYYDLFQMLIRKSINLTLRWMPSHLNEPGCTKVRPADVSDVDILGNGFADKYAAEAALAHQVSLQTSTDVRYYYSLTNKIQRRLITVMQNLPARSKYRTVRMPAEEQASLQQKVGESMHTVVLAGERAACSVCLDSFRVKDPAFQLWLAGICTPTLSTNRPSHYPANKILHVGNRYTHPSHKIQTHRGLVYCAKCGCRATNQMRLMGNRCVPPGLHGKASLKAILADRLPPGLDEWPD
jgi:hypothetical protein